MNRCSTATIALILACTGLASAQQGSGALTLGSYRGHEVMLGAGYADVSITPQYAVCYNATEKEFFIVFQATQPGTSNYGVDLRGQRVDATTGSLKGPSVLIDDSAGGGQAKAEAPSVAWCSASNLYMVCYRWFTFPLAKFLDPTGAVVTTTNPMHGYGRVLLNEKNNVGSWSLTWSNPVGVASDGNGFVVVFSDWDDVWDQFGGLWARRFKADGTAAGPKVNLGPLADCNDISWLGGPTNRFLVAYPGLSYEDSYWSAFDLGHHVDPALDMHVVTLDVMDDQIQVWESRILASTGLRRNLWPRIAANTTDQEWIVTWEESDTDLWSGEGVADPGNDDWESQAPAAGTIRFQRVALSGATIGGGEFPAETTAIHLAPAVAWDETTDVYVIRWQRGGIGSADIAGARIVGGNDEIIPDAAAVASTPADEYTPIVVSQPGPARVLSIWGSGTTLLGRFSDPTVRPDPPFGLVQLQLDGATPLPVGGITRGTVIVLKANCANAGTSFAGLEVEVQLSGTPFSGSPNRPAGPLVKNGSVARLDVDSLSIDLTYHYQIRAVNTRHAVSDWVVSADPAFTARSNAKPSVSPLGQVAADGTVLAKGTTIFDGDGAKLRVAESDPDGDLVTVAIELAPSETPFSGRATWTSSPTTAGTVEFPLLIAQGHYHWQVRSMDAFGGDSGWKPFSASGENSADFILIAGGSAGPTSCLGSAAGSPSLGSLAGLGALLAFLRRRPLFR